MPGAKDDNTKTPTQTGAQPPEPKDPEKAKRTPPKPTILDGLRAAGLTMELGGREIPAPRAAGLLARTGFKPDDPLPKAEVWAKALKSWNEKKAGADTPKPADQKKEG